jgi:hypothetical protein
MTIQERTTNMTLVKRLVVHKSMGHTPSTRRNMTLVKSFAVHKGMGHTPSTRSKHDPSQNNIVYPQKQDVSTQTKNIESA